MGSFVRSAIRHAIGLICAAPFVAGAQGARQAQGVVQRATSGEPRPLAGAWVVLHRVARDGQGAGIDSVRTGPRGTYEFRFGSVADSAAYFTSTKYLSVVYFTPPFAEVSARGDATAITVFDTTSTGTQVRARGRHVIVFAGDSAGRRQLAEVFWLENASAQTRVSSGNTPTWSSPLPDGAANVRVEQGDVPRETVRAANGRVEVFAPIAPGLRQLHVSYTVPLRQFPLTFAVPDTTMMLEVLVEGSGGRADGATLTAQQPAVVEQRAFQRFLGHDVVRGATFVVSLPRGTTRLSGWYVAGIVGMIGAVLMMGFARTIRGGSRVRMPLRSTPARAEALAHEIAALDEQFARRATPTDDERTSYSARRDALKMELTAVLAERDDQL